MKRFNQSLVSDLIGILVYESNFYMIIDVLNLLESPFNQLHHQTEQVVIVIQES